MSESDMSSYVEVNGWKVYYEKIGSGSHPILLIPDAIGTGRTDFEELIDGDDELDFDKFTAIAVEPPGSGRSRPPIRPYGANVYENDCQCYQQLMANLGFDKYSIIGYSEGAKVAFLMAAKYPDSVLTLLLSAFSSKITNRELKAYSAIKSVDKWSKDKINSYLAVYESKEEIQKQWNRYLKFIEFYHQYIPENMFSEKCKLIQCRTLFTHGDMDQITQVDEPTQFRMEILRKSKYLSRYEPEHRIHWVKVHRFSVGERDSHRRYAPQYAKLVQDHFLNTDNNNNNDCND